MVTLICWCKSECENILTLYFLKERDDEITELTAALKEKEEGGIAPAPMFPPVTDANPPRRSRRLASTHRHNAEHECPELMQCKAELDQCKAELDLKQTELHLKTLGNCMWHLFSKS